MEEKNLVELLITPINLKSIKNIRDFNREMLIYIIKYKERANKYHKLYLRCQSIQIEYR